MIYESTVPNQTLQRAAITALDRNCDKFLHGGQLFAVDINWRPIADVKPISAEKPVAKPKAIPKAAPEPVPMPVARKTTTTETELISLMETYLEASGPATAVLLATGINRPGIVASDVLAVLEQYPRFQKDARGFWELKRVAEAVRDKQ